MADYFALVGDSEGVVAVNVGIAVFGAILGAIAGIPYSANIFSIIFAPSFTADSTEIRAIVIGFASAFLSVLLNTHLAWRAIKGDEKQSFILRLVLAQMRWLTWWTKWSLVKWEGTSFYGSNLTTANFSEAILKNTDFRDTNLTRTCWYKSKQLLLAHVKGTILQDYSVRELLTSGIGIHKSLVSKNLKGANLAGFDLTGADLTEADISGADLQGAKLNNAKLIKTQAIGTLFNDADLTGACIEGWNIDHTTQLNGVNCRYIYLLNDQRERRPSFSEFGEDQFSKLFEKVFYTINTIFGVKGVEYIPSFFNEALQFNSCFISYTSTDEGFAKRLYQDLKNNNVRCWFAPENIKIGDKIRPKIDESIHSYDKLLIILSENSVKSNWVEHEIETALDKEAEQGHPVLFPIKIDDAVMSLKTGWAAKIRRERHIGDFREWMNSQKYEEALQRLLRDLKSTQK